MDAQQEDPRPSAEKQGLDSIRRRAVGVPLQSVDSFYSQNERPQPSVGTADGDQGSRRSTRDNEAETLERQADPGLVGVCELQGQDPKLRFFPPVAEAAAVCQWFQFRKIQKSYDTFCDEYQAGNEPAWEKAARNLMKEVPECYAFANSRVGIENLPYPKEFVFQKVQKYFVHLEKHGFRPPGEVGAWKALRPENRPEEFARALPEGGWVKRFFLSCFRRRSVWLPNGTKRDQYEIEGLKLFVTVLCSLSVGILLCAPVVVLASEILPKRAHIGLIVASILASGCVSAWWLRDPSFPILIMIGYAACLVSIDIPGK